MTFTTEADTLQITIATREHYEYFRNANRTWIEQYFTLEEIDHRMLDDPQRYIVDRGGYIFIALYNNTVAGTCALIKTDDLTFELAKMTISEGLRGKGLGYALGMHCIQFAKTHGIRKIELLSNTILAPAIQLYKKLGFTETVLPQTEYARANIKMEINLQPQLKATVIVGDDLTPGLALNAAALVTATLGNRVKHLIGDNVTDQSGGVHAGLTWLPIAILKADRTTIKKVREDAAKKEQLLIVDIPEQAQQTRTYEDFRTLMQQTAAADVGYLALGLYGDKSTITALTKAMPLYK